jgi:4-amino-4-deoxy-L-arabinose transferase-like glycosyltransferase
MPFPPKTASAPRKPSSQRDASSVSEGYLSNISESELRDRPIDAKSDIGFTVALLVVALVPRLFVALAWAREPVWDGHYYHLGAERLADGFGYSEDVIVDGRSVWKPWTHYPVGYSALLSLAYRVFGSGLLTAPVVNALLGTIIVVVVHRLARYALSQNRARVAGTLCALHPGLIAYSSIVMTEPAAALFVLFALWVAVAMRTSVWGFLAAGALIGMGALIRPVSLLALPTLLLVGCRPHLTTLMRTTAAGIVSLLVIFPWTYRNCQVMDGCALISTNGGWNLAIGALTETGRFRTLKAEDGCPIVTGQVQQDRCWAEVGAQKIKDDPQAWLKLIPMKLAQTFDHESFPVEYLHESSPDLWPESRRKAGRELLTIFHWLLMAGAALSPIALVTSVRRRVSAATQGILLLCTVAYGSYCFASPSHPFFALMVMIPILAVLPFPGRPRGGPAGRALFAVLFLTTLTHAVFFGDDRYHLVLSPMLCILAAAALRVRSHPAKWAPR